MDNLNPLFRKVADTTVDAVRLKARQAAAWVQQNMEPYPEINEMERQYYHDMHFKHAEDCGDDAVNREHELDITHEHYPIQEPEVVFQVVPRTRGPSPITGFSGPEEPARCRQTWESFVARTPSPAQEPSDSEEEVRGRLKTVMADYAVPSRTTSPIQEAHDSEEELKVRLKTIMADYTGTSRTPSPAEDDFDLLRDAEHIAAMNRPRVEISESQAEKTETGLKEAMEDDVLSPWKPWEDTRIYQGPRDQSPEYRRTDFTDEELAHRERVKEKILTMQERDARFRRRIVGGYEKTGENARIDAYTGIFIPTLEGWDGMHEKRSAPVLNLPPLIDFGNYRKLTKHREDYEFVQHAGQPLGSKPAEGRSREETPVPTYSEVSSPDDGNDRRKKKQSRTAQSVFGKEASQRKSSRETPQRSDTGFIDDDGATESGSGKFQPVTDCGVKKESSLNNTTPQEQSWTPNKEYCGTFIESDRTSQSSFAIPNKSVTKKHPSDGLQQLIDYNKLLACNTAAAAAPSQGAWKSSRVRSKVNLISGKLHEVPVATPQQLLGATKPANITLFEWVGSMPSSPELINSEAIAETELPTAPCMRRQEPDLKYSIDPKGLKMSSKTSEGHIHQAAPNSPGMPDQKSSGNKSSRESGHRRASYHPAELTHETKEEGLEKYEPQEKDKPMTWATPLSPGIWERTSARHQEFWRNSSARATSSTTTKQGREKKEIDSKARAVPIVPCTPPEAQPKARRSHKSQEQGRGKKGNDLDDRYICKPAAICQRRNDPDDSDSDASFHTAKSSITPPYRRPVWPASYAQAQPGKSKRESGKRGSI
ncbi:hypothetical protein BP6252_11480 [Coleophoma cylindrospora]|uniref:Uncharacterized protein n=1 Tax=Coleophoma cylindrospora TaxID=1849047 RepID=A0A3D8QJX0_9HELO|nr:hypothetical protein BP6252_11480 [Coleophoma cylindrospora]